MNFEGVFAFDLDVYTGATAIVQSQDEVFCVWDVLNGDDRSNEIDEADRMVQMKVDILACECESKVDQLGSQCKKGGR